MFKEIKFIAFDLDGTLLDSVPDLAWAADKAVREVGFSGVTEAQVRDYVGNGADILIGRALSQNIIVDSQLSPALLHSAREHFDHFYAQSEHRRSHLYPNVFQTLTRLAQAEYQMAVVTNKPSHFVPEILQQHQLTPFFTDVLGGDAFSERKPSPVALNWLMEKHQLQPSQLLMVGDSKSDILAARNARCAAFGLTYGYNHGEPIANASPDVVADDIADLLTVLALGETENSTFL
ncbi:phosphoglycolate phosphatase [Vibrio sp. SM6]|uniref:Phosphoglycolate phosphatase n=1 Tax=Vibrio agarilyticus TaxID=2726741 RepID=A0A7X8TTS8_9VIBR|nr:phosphoglycolate phosphatase [Vibrio agarilyticus]